jgi:hypothetical protein
MPVTKKDILNDLELIKEGLKEIEFYLKNNVTDDNEIIEKGVNGVIDYMRKILKDLISTNAISYTQILEDAKKKGLEREFRTAYRLLKQLNFISYDQQNKIITIGSRTKYLMKLFTDSKFEKKQEEKTIKIDQKKVNEIYYWILDQIIKNEWVSLDTIKEIFKGYENEILEAIDKIVSEGKGELVDNKAIYKVDSKKSKTTEADISKRIKELKDQIKTLERRIQIGRSTKLAEEYIQKLEEEKKKLEDELKKLESKQ